MLGCHSARRESAGSLTWCCLPLFLFAVAALVGGCGGSSPQSSSIAPGSGRIVGMVSNLPLSGTIEPASAEAVAVSLDGIDLSAQTVMGGTFTLNNVPTGLHTLVARTSTQACAVVLTVESGEVTDVGLLQLRRAGQVSGTVTTRDGQPIEGALVRIRHISTIGNYEGFPEPVRHAYTDAAGAYIITGLPVDDETNGFGDYMIRVTKPGMAAWTDLTGIWWFEDSIRVYDPDMWGDATLTYDIQMVPLPEVESGTVVTRAYITTEDGIAPLSGASQVLIRLGSDAEPEPWGGSDFGPDGKSVLERVPVGEYTLSVVRPGIGTSSQQITVTSGVTVEREFVFNTTLQEICVVDGIVRDRLTKEPRPGIAVVGYVSSLTRGIVIRPDEVIMASATDDLGRFHLVVPVQVTTLIAHSGPGGGWYETPISLTPGGHLNVVIEIDF